MSKQEYLYGFGQRVKQRREEIHMSQEELANKVGYKSRSSINKIELGKNDVVQSTLQKLADALDTTPAYLMGWEEDLIAAITEDSKSGRTAAKEEMYRTFGIDHQAADLRLLGDKVALLYYKAMDCYSAPALLDIATAVENLNRDELENIRLVVRAYLRADAPIKEIVDTALKPYREEESLDTEDG